MSLRILKTNPKLLHLPTPGCYIYLPWAVTFSYSGLLHYLILSCYIYLLWVVTFTYSWLLHLLTLDCYIYLLWVVTFTYSGLLQLITLSYYIYLLLAVTITYSGLLHLRIAIRTPPPQVLEQSPYTCHPPQLPSTGLRIDFGTHSPCWHHCKKSNILHQLFFIQNCDYIEILIVCWICCTFFCTQNFDFI